MDGAGPSLTGSLVRKEEKQNLGSTGPMQEPCASWEVFPKFESNNRSLLEGDFASSGTRHVACTVRLDLRDWILARTVFKNRLWL